MSECRRKKGNLSQKGGLLAGLSDLELIRASLKGDGDDFAELCRRYYPAMVAISHSILGDRHLAEDAAQQAFANAVRKLPQLKNEEKFGVWLAAICRNAAMDLLRKNEKLCKAEQLPEIAADRDGDETVDIVRDAVNDLPAQAKEVIFLKFYDGLSYEQISAMLGISEQAINGRLRRARKKIADHLKHRGIDGVEL